MSHTMFFEKISGLAFCGALFERHLAKILRFRLALPYQVAGVRKIAVILVLKKIFKGFDWAKSPRDCMTRGICFLTIFPFFVFAPFETDHH